MPENILYDLCTISPHFVFDLVKEKDSQELNSQEEQLQAYCCCSVQQSGYCIHVSRWADKACGGAACLSMPEPRHQAWMCWQTQTEAGSGVTPVDKTSLSLCTRPQPPQTLNTHSQHPPPEWQYLQCAHRKCQILLVKTVERKYRNM